MIERQGLARSHSRRMLWTVAVLGCVAPVAAEAPTYQVLSNIPFETVVRGYPGAVCLDVPDAFPPAQVSGALRDRMRAVAQAGVASRTRREVLLRRLGLLKPGRHLPLERRTVVTRQGVPLMPDLSRRLEQRAAFGNGTLTFQYSGWSVQDQAVVQRFVNSVMPYAVSVYGLAVTDLQVTIVMDAGAGSGGRDIPGFGYYSAALNELHYFPVTDSPLNYDDFVVMDGIGFTHLLLHAFHDEAQFAFDAWEEGFAFAASLLIQQYMDPLFDPTLDGSFADLLPVYDCENQPPLGNIAFFAASGYEGMGWWRLAMASSAWLKVHGERASFFRDFNAAYYQQFDPKASVPVSGNVPALKQIALGLVPQVEGLSFTDWYRRQGVLDTSITSGDKLYVFNVPTDEFEALGVGVNVILEYYRTLASGNEQPLSGTAQLRYYNDLSDDLYAEAGYEAVIPEDPTMPGEGFIAPAFYNVGGPNRIMIEVTVGNLQQTVVFPYAVSGGSEGGNDLYGAVLGNDEGTMSVSVNGGSTVQTEVTRGVFSFPPGLLAPYITSKAVFTFENTATKVEATVQRIVGNFSTVVLIETPRGDTPSVVLSHTFPRGTNGFHLMSIPLKPLKSDEAEVLGIPADQLLLARWRPRLTSSNKYELYPNITEPFAPGLGYWLRVLEDRTVQVGGVPASTSENFVVELKPGFNQIGPPFNSSVTLSSLRFRVGISGQEVTLSEAQGQGLIGQGLFKYSQQSGYQIEQAQLEPWVGYWIRCTKAEGVYMIFPPPGAASSRSRASVANSAEALTAERPGPLRWKVKIGARTEGACDNENFFGVMPRATDRFDERVDVVQPPDFARFVSLSFPAQSVSGPLKLSGDFRRPVAAQQEWQFVVETDLPGQDTTLTWDVAELPRLLQATVVDLATQQTVNMRAVGQYTYRSSPDGAPRLFLVRVKSPRLKVLRLSGLQVVRRGPHLLVAFRAERACHVAVSLRDLQGRTIGSYEVPKRIQEGRNVLAFDLRRAPLDRLPRGVCIVVITASDEDRHVVRLLRALRMEDRAGELLRPAGAEIHLPQVK